jgi:hypothetical protein
MEIIVDCLQPGMEPRPNGGDCHHEGSIWTLLHALWRQSLYL